MGTDLIFFNVFKFKHFLRTRTGSRSVEKTCVEKKKVLSFVQSAGVLAFVLFSDWEFTPQARERCECNVGGSNYTAAI